MDIRRSRGALRPGGADMSYVNCLHCKTPLEPDGPDTFRRVAAWERKSRLPSRRAGSDLVLREHADPQEFCCGDCIRGMKRGVAPLQESLLGVET